MKPIRALLTIVLVTVAWIVNAQELIVYNSKLLPRTDSVWVFTPVKKTLEKPPLIFLLHGYGGSYKQWDAIMNAQQYADKYGFIIVCPDGLYNSWYLNSPIKADLQYESFFFDELWVDIMRRYSPDLSNIFISGLSMGGHGALSLYTAQPDKFKSAGSTSGATYLVSLFNKYGIDAALSTGKPDTALLARYSVHEKLKKLHHSKKPIIFDCGTEDAFNAMNNDLKLLTDQLKIPATYISQPGAHNRAYWAKSIRQHFEFFTALLAK